MPPARLRGPSPCPAVAELAPHQLPASGQCQPPPPHACQNPANRHSLLEMSSQQHQTQKSRVRRTLEPPGNGSFTSLSRAERGRAYRRCLLTVRSVDMGTKRAYLQHIVGSILLPSRPPDSCKGTLLSVGSTGNRAALHKNNGICTNAMQIRIMMQLDFQMSLCPAHAQSNMCCPNKTQLWLQFRRGQGVARSEVLHHDAQHRRPQERCQWAITMDEACHYMTARHSKAGLSRVPMRRRGKSVWPPQC